MLEQHYTRVELYVYNLRGIRTEISRELENAVYSTADAISDQAELEAIMGCASHIDTVLTDAFLDMALHDLEIVSVNGVNDYDIPTALRNAMNASHALRSKLRSIWALPIRTAGCVAVTKRQGNNYHVFVIDPESDMGPA